MVYLAVARKEIESHRQKILIDTLESNQKRILYANHHLLGTKAVPGVYTNSKSFLNDLSLKLNCAAASKKLRNQKIPEQTVLFLVIFD